MLRFIIAFVLILVTLFGLELLQSLSAAFPGLLSAFDGLLDS